MSKQQNNPSEILEHAAQILGVPLNSECLANVIANHENFHALFHTIDRSGRSDRPNPLDSFKR